MEFPFDVAALLGAPPDCEEPFVGRIDEDFMHGYAARPLCDVLDLMGKASAVAQGLRKPVTVGTPHLSGQRVYLMAQGAVALGLLKVGEKRLFVAPPALANQRASSGVQDALREINPLCALDFYVHESCQRGGFGRRIFDAMLRQEGQSPAKMAFDRPSPKLIGFLAKHFELIRYRPQNNNYVVFDDFFLDEAPARVGGDSRWQRGPPSAGRAPGAARRSAPQESGFGVFSSLGPSGDALPAASAARPPSLPQTTAPWDRSATWDRPPPLQRPGSNQNGGLKNGHMVEAVAHGRHSSHDAARPSWEWDVNGHDGRCAPGGTAGMSSSGGSRGGAGDRARSLPTGAVAGLARSGNGAGYGRGGAGAEAPAAGCPSRAGPGGNCSNRYPSPLSHAGHRMMRQSPIC